tara:strand:- start:1896 stop:2480 length:585 start_codon:yes stop_codon:yes gene_type:complete
MKKKSMDRLEALQLLNNARTGEIVVAVYQAATTWANISNSDLNYTFTGAMGQGSSHALGLALGKPNKRVIVLDGDGSLLMNLGTLVTIGNIKPKNLIHCVCINGTYETNGSIAIPGNKTISFADMAKAAGYESIFSFNSIEKWGKAIPKILASNQLSFVELFMEPEKNKFKDNFKELYSTNKRNLFIEKLKNQN